jgi:hypothetical protein
MTRAESTPGSASNTCRQAAYCSGEAEASISTGLTRLAAGGSRERIWSTVAAARGANRARSRKGVGGNDPGPPASLRSRPVALGQGRVRERPRPVEHLLGAIGAQDPGPLEGRVKGRFRAGQRTSVRGGGSLARLGAAHFQGDDRFHPRHLTRDPHEATALGDAFL